MLPDRAQFRSRETLASIVSRVAAANWVDARTLASDKAVSWQKIIDGNPEALTSLAEMGVDIPTEVLNWSPVKHPQMQRSIHHHYFPSKIIQAPGVRGCPACLRSDAGNIDVDPGQFMALRGDWFIPHVTLCHEHHHPLVLLWRDPKPHSRLDSAAHFRALAPQVHALELDQEKREPTLFDVWFSQRLHGQTKNSNWLDQYPLHVAATFCFMLGSTLRRHSTHVEVDQNDWLTYQLGFAVASEGEDAILQALGEIQRLPARPLEGPKAIFPVLYERLSRQYIDQPEYEPFRKLLRGHMLKTWPLGIGDELLGQPVLHRTLHSVSTAADETGLDDRRLRSTLAGYGIVRGSDEGFSNAWEVFDAAAAAHVLTEVAVLVPANRFAALLGASRSQFDIMVADGVFAPALLEANVKAVWRPSDATAFLDEMRVRSSPLSQVPLGWVHISKSAQQLKTRPGRIVNAIRAGEIKLLGNYLHFKGYQSLYVDHEEVTAVLGNTPPPAQSIEIFSKSVGINQPSRMRRLIKNGHAKATLLKNPRTNAQQYYLTPEDISDFHAKFATPRTIAVRYNCSWQKVCAELKVKRIQPFTADGEDYGSLFLLSEVVSALS